ncbi:MAG: ATP-binding cassette domain-containing protein, partial [Propionibacteriaceae bacterium]|nr:ATP-binding cassette domain-containing protein [Propionibacteriaceae bacterium]
GAVKPWNMFNWKVQPDIARELGVRTDVPWRDLEDWEKNIVLDGPEEKKEITLQSKKGVRDIGFTFRNARLTVTEELRRAKDEKRLARVSRFLIERTCPACHGTRLSPAALHPEIDGLNLAQASAKTLDELIAWAPTIIDPLPRDMHSMARALVDQLTQMTERLAHLGLGYLALDRAGSTLSTGERQRVQLARAVRNRTTGVLYVLDEPSIGMHPSNIDGLLELIGDLLADGNSVLVVDHDVQVLREADEIIEIGPGSGGDGGTVIAQGSVELVTAEPASRLAPFLDGREEIVVREQADPADMFEHGEIRIVTEPIHTVHALDVRIPRGRMSVVTGVSGSGKTTMVLESLVPALRAVIEHRELPEHVDRIEESGIRHVHRIDATPIGVNIRSTVATYSGVLDPLRSAFAETADAQARGLKMGDFSYNTGALRCSRCRGTGRVELDVQFLPDMDIDCPDCEGRRYGPEADTILRDGVSLPALMGATVVEAMDLVGDIPAVCRTLQILVDLGLGYLTLGEDTPALSGGEAQRLKLAGQMGRTQSHAVFVFDEPSVGLHPLDVRTLVHVLDRLLEHGATVVVIEHDLDMVANADWVIDIGPGGGESGGRVVATGTPEQVVRSDDSMTGAYLRRHLGS